MAQDIRIFGEAADMTQELAKELGVTTDEAVARGLGLICHLVKRGYLQNDIVQQKGSLQIKDPKSADLVSISWSWSSSTLPVH